jgi:hypothetical protein
VKGLKYLFYFDAWASPTSKAPVFKSGVELNNDKTKFKWYFNMRTWITEISLTYQAKNSFIFGSNFVLDTSAKNLDKYDFGVSWSPAAGAFVGLKHESTTKEAL